MLYIHIPFCSSKCPYCGFNSFVNDDFKAYFNALCREAKKLPKILNTIYVGGGTPSIVDVSYYEKLFNSINHAAKEITIEANPNGLDLYWLKAIRSIGFNRISLGTQSFCDEKLHFLGRKNTSKDNIRAYKLAQKAGFENINIDIIYSTNVDSKETTKKELNNIKSLQPSHVSAYELTIEPNTPFEKKPNKHKENLDLARLLTQNLSNDFLWYEVSNFGKICEHNLGYWQGRNYYAIGAGSVSTINNTRFYAPNVIKKYIDNPFFKQKELLDPHTKKNEEIFLGLRSMIGVEISHIDNKKALEILLSEGLLHTKGTRVYNNDYFLTDEISLFLMDKQ